MVAEIAGRRAADSGAVEVLLLDEPEAAALEEVARDVAELDLVAGRGRRPDRVLLLVPRDLRRDTQLPEDALVTQRVVAPAELLLPRR